MDGAMGKEEDVVEAVLTCEGDFHDPELQNQIERFRHKLKDLLHTDSRKVQVRKVEPWNSVKVTLTIPKEAAIRLRQLAQNGNEALRQMGVLSVQVQGDSQIALTFLGSNNEQREVVLSSSPAAQVPSGSASGSAVQQQVSNPPPAEAVVSLDDLASSPGPSSDEVTRKNIVDYLRQGPHLCQNVALIGSLMGAVGAVSSSSSPSRLGVGQDIPTVSNPSTNTIGVKTHSYRPNNIATVGAAASQYQGSQVAKNFPFKTTGAFHPPVSRYLSSAGQNLAIVDSATSSTSPQLQQQPNSTNPPIIKPATICQVSAATGAGQHGLVSSMNNFSPLGPHPSGLNSSIISSSILPSPSSSNYFVDLPPPPPYPHGASSAASPRANKPGNASSPMLVNLLQTDPSVAAAGMASGNPNKPLTMGEQGVSDSSPKKKRNRKQKTLTAKPSNELASSRNDFQPSSIVAKTIDSNSNPLNLEQAITAADTHKPLNTKLDSSATFGVLRDHKVSLSIKDSHRDGFTSSGNQSDSNKSAIVARTKNSLLLESNRKVDVLSSETAAGKIINPYTGQLEPRDSVMDSSLHGLKDLVMTQKSGYSATQMLAQRALELDEIAQKSVPQSSSAFLENVYSAQNVSSSTLNCVSLTSTTTAAASIVDSGKLSQISNFKKQRLDSTSSTTTLSVKGSLTQPSIYVGSSPLCQSTQNASTIESIAESQPLLPNESCSAVINKTVGHGFSNGPLIADGDRENQMRIAYSEMNKLNASGASSSSSDSVIYSNLRACSYSTTSQATLSQASLIHHVSGQKHQVRNAPVSVPHSSLSLSVSLDIPPGQTRLSCPATVAEQAKPSLINYPSFSNDSQAATSSTDSKVPSSTPVTSPSLLNSVPEKHIDSLSSTESPPETKVLSEGDENSDHSGIVAESGPEHSGTAALIEHSRVKIENHDSGIGSSSERSDDTPSEPGDGEFRTSQSVTDAEDNNIKASVSQKLVDCKPDPPLVTVDTSITVGYTINASSDNISGKPTSSKGVIKKPFVGPASSAESSGSDISQFYDAHCKSLEKQAGLMAVEQVSLSNCLSEKADVGYHQYGSKVKENGPTTSSSMENRASPKLNGPSSQGSLNSMMAAMNELHAKKMKLSPKQGGLNNKDPMNEEHQEKESVIERLNRIHHQLQDQKESLSFPPSGLQEMKGAETITDKSQREVSLSHRLEGHTEQLFLDLEEMQMKMMGNGASVVTGGGNSAEGKGGNITSIYSKRSSPVNVNMLNHIYASGLPLPRRLTESVQRLVKPLPASEMGMSLTSSQSRAYNSKSPVSSSIGTLPKAGTTILPSTNGPHHPTRMANHSGARSPGASMPRLIPNDQHRLLSGGLDLAGLTNFQMPLCYGADPVSSSGGTISVGGHMPTLSSHSMREDLIVKGDPHTLSMNLHSPSLLRDSQPYSNRMLSQSYPPFKTKDHLTNLVQRNHDIQMNHNLSKSNEVVQHSFNDSKVDNMSDIQEKGNLQYSVHSHALLESKGSRLSNQCVAEESDINHSSKHTDGSEPNKFSFSSCNSSSLSAIVHSNASSPLMPILQRGQEPPITPTFPSSMPSISSQPPLISLATTEISNSQEDSPSKPATSSAPLTQSQSVPCSSSVSVNSLTTKINLEKPKGNVEVPIMGTHASQLPILSPIVSKSTPLLEGHTDTPQVHAKGSADFQEHRANDRSDPPKLTKAQSVTSLSSFSLKASTPNHQTNRNIFDSVSAESLPRQTAFNSLSPKLASMDHGKKFNFMDDKPKTCDNSLQEQNIFDHVIDLNSKAVAKPLDTFHKNFSENGSKQHSSITPNLSELENSKFVKSRQLLSSASNNLEPKTIVSNNDIKSEEMQDNDTAEIKAATTSPLPHSSSSSSQISVSGTIAPVKRNSSSPDIPMPSSSSVIEVAKAQFASGRPLDVSSGSSCAIATVLGNGDTCTSQSVADGGESSISGSPMKEPILETLASALKKNNEPSSQSSHNSFGHPLKTSEKGPSAQRPPMIPLTASDISKLEQSMTLQARMVAVQSSPQIKTSATEPVSCAAAELVDSGSSHSRVTRKRKINSTEGELHDIEGSTRAISFKHANIISNSKSKPSEGIVNRSDKVNDREKEAGPIETGPILTKTMASSTDKSEVIKANVEHKDTAAKISADLEKSQERRRHRSITSSSQSDDGHSHRSSSNESRDCTSPSLRDGRLNKTAFPTADKDGRTPRGSGSMSGSGQPREPKFHHRAYPGSERDAQSKENRSHRVPGHHSSEDARHTQVDWSEDHSVDDKDKIKLPGAKVSMSAEKFSCPDSKDDGQKKVQRVKRQFYAYVPEKSLDQTYFDTPILSGRTRSKNKPLEEETSAGTGGVSTPSTGDTHVPSSVAHNTASSTITVTGQSVGHSKHSGDLGVPTVSDAGTGGKRSTRSVRTKDASQEQNPNKRRKVQQQR